MLSAASRAVLTASRQRGLRAAVTTDGAAVQLRLIDTAVRFPLAAEAALKVVLDLMVVRFLDRWIGKPIYIFGGFGALWFGVGAVSAVYMLYLKFFSNLSMIQTPLPLLVVMSIMMGIMSICIGLVAEIVVRTYFESQGKTIYHTRELINLDRPPSRRAG